MAPEIFKKTGHGKPVDVWAMGVITYFLLCGYTPFDRDTQQQEMEAIIAGDYKFEPAEYWANVSETAKDFVRDCLTIDPASRPTADEALRHKWLASTEPHYVEDASGNMTNLLPQIQKAFDARKTWRKAVFSIQAMRRMSTMAAQLSPSARALGDEVAQYKEESEKVRMGGPIRAWLLTAACRRTSTRAATSCTTMASTPGSRRRPSRPSSRSRRRWPRCPSRPSHEAGHFCTLERKTGIGTDQNKFASNAFRLFCLVTLHNV